MSDIYLFTELQPSIDGSELLVEITPFNPKIRLGAEFDIIVFELVTVLFRAEFMLCILFMSCLWDSLLS